MTNNDILIRLRYALNLKDGEMVKIFKLGGIEFSLTDILNMLKKDEDATSSDEFVEKNYIREVDAINKCNNTELNDFLNGLILYKRGPQENKNNTPRQEPTVRNQNINNLLLKKVKIALQLTSEEMLEIFELAGITISKGELGAVLRKEGNRNYKECGDRYARNFLKGLTIKYRKTT